MSLYLSPYIGAGVKGNPFRPTGIDNPGSSAIDLRVDCTRADGGGLRFALLWLPVGIPDPLGSIKLADDHGERATTIMKNLVTTRFGVDLSRDATIQDIVETILLRPDNGHWHRLRPANGRLEAWLGSGTGKRRWIDNPVVAGGSISDNFNRADETPVSAPWTQLAGSASTINLASNALTNPSAGDTFYYYSHAGGWDADQTSQWTYASHISSSDWGAAVRIGSNGFSGYWYSLYEPGSSISKYVAGSYTQVELTGSTSLTGDIYKLSAIGSTLSYSINGTELANSPVTDTSLATAGNGPGVFIYDDGGSLDDFVATGEISAGGGAPHLLPLLGVGGLIRVAALARLHEPVDRRTLAKLLGAVAWGPK